MIDRTEAADALAGIDRARERGTILAGYAHAGDILIAWGLVWLAGDLTGQFAPDLTTWVWLPGIVIAVLFTIVRAGGSGERDWRPPLLALLAFAFLILLELLIGGADARLNTALASLIVATVYIGLGLWAGLRYSALGLAIVAAILLGWFAFPAWLYLWLGLGGGGALILSGLWLRRA